ncbi:Yippee/Mis18-like [Parasponia andersonii]|uniref:Protein yippee-like n=1 Tax=Parasponia andersonii TaxID=3476 RepID=A0A2P5DFE4_PARAD|nr:Yippee/Mis18-like [Parasponia andersonii]
MAEFRGQPLYNCRNCRNPIALRDDLISKKFKGKSGPAYLFSHAMNITLGPKRDKQLITGVFTIADIYCRGCGEELGWKYITAHDATQRYKEGKFIIEISKIAKLY